MPKMPKTREEWIGAIVHQWWMKLALVALTAFSGWVYTSGQAQAQEKAKSFVLDTVRPAMDSMRTEIDTLKGQLTDLTEDVKEARRENRAAFGALMDAIPAFQQAVKERGQENDAAEKKKAETDRMLDNLSGSTP